MGTGNKSFKNLPRRIYSLRFISGRQFCPEHAWKKYPQSPEHLKHGERGGHRSVHRPGESIASSDFPVGNFTAALADEPGLETATHAATPNAGSFPHTAVS